MYKNVYCNQKAHVTRYSNLADTQYQIDELIVAVVHLYIEILMGLFLYLATYTYMYMYDHTYI